VAVKVRERRRDPAGTFSVYRPSLGEGKDSATKNDLWETVTRNPGIIKEGEIVKFEVFDLEKESEKGNTSGRPEEKGGRRSRRKGCSSERGGGGGWVVVFVPSERGREKSAEFLVPTAIPETGSPAGGKDSPQGKLSSMK